MIPFYGEAGMLSTDPPQEAGFKITMPQDVRDAKLRIDPQMASTRGDVKACAQLSAADKDAFEAFYLSWRRFYCDNSSGQCSEPYAPLLFGSGGQVDDADAFESQLYAWQVKVKSAGCAQATPPVMPPTPGWPGAGQVSDTAKWATIGILALAGVYVVSKTGLPKLFGTTKGRR
jgi:hypothetical protein